MSVSAMKNTGIGPKKPDQSSSSLENRFHNSMLFQYRVGTLSSWSGKNWPLSNCVLTRSYNASLQLF